MPRSCPFQDEVHPTWNSASARWCSRRSGRACCASWPPGRKKLRRRRVDVGVRSHARRRRKLRSRAGRIRRRPARRRAPPDRYQRLRHRSRGARASCSMRSWIAGPASAPRIKSPAVQRFREMIGRDEKMLVVFEWIRTAAKSDIAVLILGPTGSGKELVARMIHDLSRRSKETLSGRQLRRAARHALRVRDLRLRKGRLHRRARPQAGSPRAGRSRHAVPRRDRRPVDHRSGQAASRARGSAVRAARRTETRAGRLPADLRDQPPARAVRSRLRAFVKTSTTGSTRSRSDCPRCGSGLSTFQCSPTGSWRGTVRLTGCRSTPRRSTAEATSLLQSYPWPGNIRELESTVSRAALSAPGRTDPWHATSSSCTVYAPRGRHGCRGCPRCATPSGRTSLACSTPFAGTRRRRRGCSKSVGARCIGRSWNTALHPMQVLETAQRFLAHEPSFLWIRGLSRVSRGVLF